jgi:hypothetical protein
MSTGDILSEYWMIFVITEVINMNTDALKILSNLLRYSSKAMMRSLIHTYKLQDHIKTILNDSFNKKVNVLKLSLSLVDTIFELAIGINEQKMIECLQLAAFDYNLNEIHGHSDQDLRN